MTPHRPISDSKPARTVAMMMSVTVIGKIMGLLRDRFLGGQFGTDTAESIAFAQASILPRTFLDIMFAAAFTASFIPVFTNYMETRGKQAAFDLAAIFISFVIVLTAAVAVLSIVFAQPIISLVMREEYPPGTIELAVTLLRYMLPLMVFSGLAFAFTGMLQTIGEFRIPAAMSIVSNGIILAYFFLFIDRFGVYGLAIAFLIGWGMQAVIQVPFLVKHKFRFRFRLNLKDPGLRQIGKLALPAMLSTWIVPINLLINIMASGQLYGGEHGIVAISFAHSLFAIVSGLFVLSVANVIFPKFSRLVAAKDMKGFGDTVNETFRVLLFFLLPLTVGLMTLATPLVRLILQTGLFGETSVQITGTALMYYAIGIIGYGLLIVLGRVCFAMHNGRTPVIAAIVAIIVNAVLSFALAPVLEIAGPALASAIASTSGALILVVVLTHSKVLKWQTSTFLDIAKMAAATALMLGVVLFGIRLAAQMHVILQVAVPAALGGIAYLGLAAVLRIKEMNWIKNIIKRNN